MNKFYRICLPIFCAIIYVFILCGCGGGGGGSSSQPAPAPAPQPPPNNSWTISGKVSYGGSGLSDVNINISPSSSSIISTGSDGTFKFTGLANNTYKITPIRSGYNFDPPISTIVLNGADANTDFNAIIKSEFGSENATFGTITFN